MKKILSFALVIILIISGCAKKPQQAEQTPPPLNEYLENIDSFQAPIRNFGEPVNNIDMEGDMVTSILYPQTEFDFVNKAVKNWVDETNALFAQETAEFQNKSEPSELNIAYESDVIPNSYSYIKLSGTFASSQLAHPVEFFKTLNVNTKTKKLVAIKDIFTDDGFTTFKDKFVKTAGIDQSVIDDNLLNHFVLKRDGLEIVLARGDYFPMSDGTKTFFFSYSGIKDLLDDGFELNPNPPKKKVTPTPTPQPTPQVTPTPTQKVTPAPQKTPEPEKKATPAPSPTASPKATTTASGKKMIALTFDDGPSAHTSRLLDLFKKYGGKGTFFVLGNLIDRRPDTLIRMRDEGHQIASHGWDHRQLTKLSSQQIKDQLMMTRAKIFDTTGVDTLIMRPPYGSCNDKVKAVGKELGITFINWSIDTLDWKTKNANSIYNEIIKSANNGAIVLCHDLYGTTIDAMEKVIPKLLADGYELVTVDELLASKELEAGKLYYRR